MEQRMTFIELESPISGLLLIRAMLRYDPRNSNIAVQLLPRHMFEASQTNTTLTAAEFSALSDYEVKEILVKFLGKDTASGIRALLK